MAFLRSSADAFDNGFEDEALRMAVALRVLLHDTESSHSLLSQLGAKDELRFADTATGIAPGVGPTVGLAAMRITTGPGGAEYRPPLGNLSPIRIRDPKPFEHWWTEPVTKDQ